MSRFEGPLKSSHGSAPEFKVGKQNALSYYRELWKIAVADARAGWTAHKLATTIPGPLLGFLASALVTRGLHNVAQVLQAITISILVFLALIGITFLASMVRSPRLLNDQKDEAIRSLQKPPQTQLEEQRRQIVIGAILVHGEDARVILRHLCAVGRIQQGH